jgi:two-component system nitrogen regulation sensor histidine kinase NtrY
MTFRRKLLLVFSLTIFLSVAAVGLLVSAVTRHAFDRSENERATALVAQFRREFSRRGDVVVRRVETIASSDPVFRMAGALNRASADAGPYFELAKTTAENHQLDFLEFVESDGTIVSSAQSPSKFGYRDKSAEGLAAAANQGAFLQQEEVQDGSELGLFAVRGARVGEHPLYVIGGLRLDEAFLSALDVPVGMRVLLYQNRGDRFSSQQIVDPLGATEKNTRSTAKLQPLVDSVRQSTEQRTAIVQWSDDRADDEEFHAIPLLGLGSARERPLLAILLVGNSRRTYVALVRRIGSAALLVGGIGIVLAVMASSWVAARVTRPVAELAYAAKEVAAGNWYVRVDVTGADELGQLADSFNRMTTELLAQRERLVQAERVAAWRELARRLAHELKNPLFPLQLTVENLVRTRQQVPEQFDEVFRESSRTLLAEIANLKQIIARFSDFSKMPQPQMNAVQVNEVIGGVLQLFQAQLETAGDTKISCETRLDPHLRPVTGDAELMHQAISNLVSNAIEAMPHGGTLTVTTRNDDGRVLIEIADTGIGLTAEQRARIFTPYYTSKKHGTGLGLAIVQSIVSDHGGRIRVQSEARNGTSFVIELPQARVAG